MYDAVLAAQEKALGMLKPGVAANDVHQAVCDEFEERGYFTDAEKGEGYIHSTGHGVGLEVHEAPSIGLREIPLQPGNIITIEPGLYYPQIGGIRLEDLVLITEHGYENLNTFEKEFVV
jgi:Xaa-Pro aminopeptidase